MGLKEGFLGANLLVKIAFVAALLANFCSWLAFTTTSWLLDDYGLKIMYLGLWRRCADKDPLDCSSVDGYANASIQAVQSFAVFGFAALNIGFFLLVLFIFWDSCKNNRDTRLASAILFLASAVTWLIAVAVFGADYYQDTTNVDADLGFSFILAIIAMIFSLNAGILIILGAQSSSVGFK